MSLCGPVFGLFLYEGKWAICYYSTNPVKLVNSSSLTNCFVHGYILVPVISYYSQALNTLSPFQRGEEKEKKRKPSIRLSLVRVARRKKNPTF